MNRKEYQNILQIRIEELQKYYDTLEEGNYIYRAITLSKINAYYDAMILAYELEGLEV